MADTAKSVTIPGAVDIHVHFREPGDNKAETIKSGSAAAALGGWSMVCDMPNNPGQPVWTLERLQTKQAIIQKDSQLPIATYAGAQPESDNLDELVKMAPSSIGLKLYGAATTGNHIDYDPDDFIRIVETWHKVAPNKPVMLHSGKDNLPEFIELIANRVGHRLHVCHLFSVKQAKEVMGAKRKGLQVTGGVCPHHILKTSHDPLTEGWFARMQPPLLDQAEAVELFELFAAGEIDVLESDHAPHSADAKWSAERENPEGIHDPGHLTCFGVPGVEFAIPLLLYQMVRGRIKLERIMDAVSTQPAKIIGISFTPNTKITWKLDEYRIGDKYPKSLSGSGWTPYMNNVGVGIVEESRVGGVVLVKDGQLTGHLPKVATTGDKL